MSKQEEIKQALAAASTEHEWDTDGTIIQWKDGDVLEGTYRQIAITEAPNPEVFDNPNHDNDAHFIAKAPEYIAYQQAEIERLEQRNQELDTWATEGFEENQKLVLEVVRIRKEKEQLCTEMMAMEQTHAKTFAEMRVVKKEYKELLHAMDKLTEFNQKFVDERDRLRKELEEKDHQRKTLLRTMQEVHYDLRTRRFHGAGASVDTAIDLIDKWLAENKPVDQEGEGNKE